MYNINVYKYIYKRVILPTGEYVQLHGQRQRALPLGHLSVHAARRQG